MYKFKQIMKKILFISMMLTVGLIFQVNTVLGQQVISEPLKDEVQETVQQSTLPVDATLITSIIGTATGLIWKTTKDKKETEQKMKQLLNLLLKLQILDYKVHTASYMYPHKNPKQILDLKLDNTPMQTQTIANEISNVINELAEFANVNFHLPQPNMTIPVPEVINATTMIEENKVQSPKVETTKSETSTPINDTSKTPPK